MVENILCFTCLLSKEKQPKKGVGGGCVLWLVTCCSFVTSSSRPAVSQSQDWQANLNRDHPGFQTEMTHDYNTQGSVQIFKEKQKTKKVNRHCSLVNQASNISKIIGEKVAINKAVH